MSFECMSLGFLTVVVILQHIRILKSIYKISYYETMLEDNGFDVTRVKNMSLWQMITK